MKNILVFMNQNELAPIGGPVGYNFALKSQLDKMGIDNIHYHIHLPNHNIAKYFFYVLFWLIIYTYLYVGQAFHI